MTSFPNVLSTLVLSILLPEVCFGQSAERVSVNTLGGQGNSNSEQSSISADGNYVAFTSAANNLVPGDTNGLKDVFVHDRQAGTTERVSVGSLGAQANGPSGGFFSLSISSDGRYVVFPSEASNLVAGDTNGYSDIFVHDRQTGVTERVSVDSLGVQGDEASGYWSRVSISSDGRYVAFTSAATNLVVGDMNGTTDAFVHDRQTGVTDLVSVSSNGIQANSWSSEPFISADGSCVVFTSGSSNLVSGDTNGFDDIFVHDRQAGVTERVSISSSGDEGNSIALQPSVSADGRYVSFSSFANNLVPADTNAHYDIFLHDRQASTTERISLNFLGEQGFGTHMQSSISADGRYVVFKSSSSNLVPGDTNGDADIFIYDRITSAVERVSVNSLGSQGNNRSAEPSITADGSCVAFVSLASNLVSADTNGQNDIFVFDRWNGLGSNSIFLEGLISAPVGFPFELTWFTTRPNSNYWLAYSENINGLSLGGHDFDIGFPYTLLATGVNASNGVGSYTTAPVPSSAAGLTIYFEVGARDAGGVLYDSNVLAVAFN